MKDRGNFPRMGSFLYLLIGGWRKEKEREGFRKGIVESSDEKREANVTRWMEEGFEAKIKKDREQRRMEGESLWNLNVEEKSFPRWTRWKKVGRSSEAEWRWKEGTLGPAKEEGPVERRRSGEKKGVVVVVVVAFGDTSPLISGSACLSPQLSRPHGARHSVFPSKFQLDA